MPRAMASDSEVAVVGGRTDQGDNGIRPRAVATRSWYDSIPDAWSDPDHRAVTVEANVRGRGNGVIRTVGATVSVVKVRVA